MPASPSLLPPARASIFYHPDGFDTGQQRLMGRQAAGEGFLRGWLRWSGCNPLSVWAEADAHSQHAEALVKAWGWKGAVERCGPMQPDSALRSGALFLPGPGLAEAAWKRAWRSDAAWSLIGVTHTTASHRVLDGFTDMTTAPVQPWDALICTSRSVLATVEQVLDGHEDWLRQRTGASAFVRPQLPVIPLGVHVDDFARNPQTRAEWRSRLGIADNAVCVLWMGRLSFHAKAHPAPLYLALERAANDSAVKAAGRPVALLLAGWFANKGQEDVFRQNAAKLCPSVSLHVVDARDREARRAVWSCGDIFTLPSDNIQETFGLAPVEGMAAGLPVVATDWDGFRDTVVDGEDGFLAPTVQPGPGDGATIAFAHDHGALDYDHYVGVAAQHAAFDIDAAGDAFARLIAQPDLRAKMGQSGQKRARTVFDWKAVIGRYLGLLAELAAIRAAALSANPSLWTAPDAPVRPPRPSRGDPFKLFETYPTAPIDEALIVAIRPGARPLAEAIAAPGHVISARFLPSQAEMEKLLARLAQIGPGPAGRLWAFAPDSVRSQTARTLGWLIKHGLVQANRP